MGWNPLEDIKKTITNPLNIVSPGLGMVDTATGGSVSKATGIGDIDLSIKDPAGMQQYTDLANQAQQAYGQQRKFMQENVDPQRKNLLIALADQASGKAPSIAEQQLKSAFDTSLKNQLALARSQRGGNAGLAARNVSNIAAQQQQNLAQQGAIAKLQERQQAQNALSNQIAAEQGYGTNILGAAMSGQSNVAAMQQQQRALNDARNKGILGAGMQLLSGGLFAKGGQVQMLAEGGQVKSKKDFYKQLKACGGKVKKLAEGGQADEEKVQKVSEMDEEAQKIYKEHGSIALQKYLQNKKMRQNMYNMPEQDYKKAEGGVMMKAGGVPGQAEHSGDNYENDKVPAMLSPGEVVVPRSVIADGPKAAAYFVDKASKDKNYNAENYAQERPNFLKALSGMKKKDNDYENFKKLIKGR